MMADGASLASALTRRPEAAPAPSPRAPRSRGPRCTARRPPREVRWPGYRQSDSGPLGPPTLEGTLERAISAGNGRVVPWAGRIARMAPVAARHPRERLLGRQGDGGALPPRPGGARAGRPGRARGALLARVRGPREERSHRAHAPLPSSRVARDPPLASALCHVRLGAHDLRPRGGRALVGARADARLPRQYLRIPDR